MKYFILTCIFFCSLFQISHGQPLIKEKEITQLVTQWNESHNTNNIQRLESLFAGNVLFYARYRTKEQVMDTKKRLLKKQIFQEIISPIQVEYYSSGTAKASFRKRVVTNNEEKEYPAYLLFEMVDGKVSITGESDLVTDENKKFVLDLGTPAGKLSKQSNQTQLLIFVIVLAVAIVSIFWYNHRKKKASLPVKIEQANTETTAAATEQTPVITSPPSTKEPEAKRSIRSQSLAFSNTNKNPEYEKGLMFEKWVVVRFNSYGFELIEWRSDKMHNGMYAKASKLPDLEFSLTTKEAHVRFAVECKWRSAYYYGQIEIARQDQLIYYKEFEHLSGKKVFIMLGVGGKPDNPADLFVIPLHKIQFHKLTSKQLEPFRRYKRTAFFYNLDTGLIE